MVAPGNTRCHLTGKMPPIRHLSLDALRGFAVMGILLMNVIGFSMPMAAYVNPDAWGGSDGADLCAWVLAFILIDGKMRGIFSLLFGASMLLVIDRADAAGQDGAAVHFRRMAWLFVLGMLHYWFIWMGDILALYALCGAAAYGLRDLPARMLAIIGAALILLNMILWGIAMLSIHDARFVAEAAGATAAQRAEFAAALADLGTSGGKGLHEDMALHLNGYRGLVEARLADGFGGLTGQIFAYGPETIGLMAWGMALFKSGILTGTWTPSRYLKSAALAYLVGLPLSAALAWAAVQSGFDPLVMADIFYIWSLPPRMVMIFGHMMLLLWLIGVVRGVWIGRVAAAGRAAFSNYIGTSVLMTLFFYGYGLGYYGSLSRWQVYLLVPAVWAAMLLWSKPWLERFRYGPLEWLWRSLARWERQSFSKD